MSKNEKIFRLRTIYKKLGYEVVNCKCGSILAIREKKLVVLDNCCPLLAL